MTYNLPKIRRGGMYCGWCLVVLLAIATMPVAAEADVVAKRDMARYCQGEASAKFSVRPQNITTLPVEQRAQGAFSVYGEYPGNGRNVRTFECRYGPKGKFQWVRGTGGAGGGQAAQDGPTNEQIRACNAVDHSLGQAKIGPTSALKPGAWEIILDYPSGSYVCNVEGNNQVTYFERLR